MSADDEARRKLEKPVLGTAQAASLARQLFGLVAEPDRWRWMPSISTRPTQH